MGTRDSKAILLPGDDVDASADRRSAATSGMTRRLRVALLTSEFPPFSGGVATYAWELATAAAQDGHDVTVLAPDYGQAAQAADTGGPLRIVRFRGGPASMRGLPARIHATRALLRGERFDIIHAIDWPFFIPLRLARRFTADARIWLTVHGSEIIYMKAARRRLPLSALGFWRQGWAEWIANSAYTRDLLLCSFPRITPASARAVPLGVSATWTAGRTARTEARRQFSLASEDILIISLGRVVRRKGHIILADALAQLPAETQARLTWWVIGPELEPDYAAALRARAATLAVRTAFLGKLPTAAVQSRLSAADLFCLPGYQDEGGRIEGFGLVFLEAAAYGVPSIATWSGGIPEAVEDGVTGLLVPERDPAAAAAALAKLIDDDAMRARFAGAAERKAKLATWQQVWRQTLGELGR